MMKKKELTDFIVAHPDWTAREISDELGVATNRINLIVKEFDLPIRRVKTSSAEINKRIAFVRAHPDWSLGEFSRKFHWNYCSIYKLCSYHRLTYRKIWSTEEEQAERLEFIRASSHLTLSEMGQILGIAIPCVLKIIKTHDLEFFNKKKGKITHHVPNPSKRNRVKSLSDHKSLQSFLGGHYKPS